MRENEMSVLLLKVVEWLLSVRAAKVRRQLWVSFLKKASNKATNVQIVHCHISRSKSPQEMYVPANGIQCQTQRWHCVHDKASTQQSAASDPTSIFFVFPGACDTRSYFVKSFS